MRKAFIAALIDIAQRDNRIWLLTGDLGFGVIEPFRDSFPDRFVNCGIAEQNMMGVAAGLALSGKIPFVYSTAPFVTIRCLEQIRNDVVHHNLPVKIVSVGRDGHFASLGFTHDVGDDDVRVMIAIGLNRIGHPLDGQQAADLTCRFAHEAGPSYIRLR